VVKKIPHPWVFLIRILLIVATGFLIFWPAVEGDWIGDDELYITANPLLHDPARLWKAWFVLGSFIEYYPIDQTVQWIQWQLWGEETFGYHLSNIILHIIGSLLVWHLLSKFNLRWAWLGGLIFVLHPMNVDSVANVCELKNTLSLPPFLMALCAYIDFEEGKRRKDYFLALTLFLVAMLCKITMMCFPFLILLYVWWKRGHLGWRDFRNAMPFLVISLVLGVTMIWCGTRFEQLYPSHPNALPTGGFLSRVALMGLVVAYYFSRFFWPMTPLPMYPRWSIDPPTLLDFLPWVVFLGVIYVLWQKRKSWGWPALLGLGFFAINMLPFSGVFIISYMNFTWVLDHFLYIPMIGLIGLVVAALERIDSQLSTRFRPLTFTIVTAAMLFLATKSQDYAALWVNPGTLLTYTVRYNPGAWLAHYNLGNDLRNRGRFDEAIEQYREALRINPSYDWAHNNLGMVLAKFPDRLPEAITEYQEALRIRPGSAEAHNNLANAWMRLPNRLSDAISEYQAALEARPNFIEAHYNLGIALSKMPDHMPEAKAQFQEALRLNPDFAPAQDMLEKLPAAQ